MDSQDGTVIEAEPEGEEEDPDLPPGPRRPRTLTTARRRSSPVSLWGFELWDPAEVVKVAALGGHGRAAALSAKRLSAIGRRGAEARWGRKRVAKRA